MRSSRFRRERRPWYCTLRRILPVEDPARKTRQAQNQRRCIHVKALSDVDEAVLETLVRKSAEACGSARSRRNRASERRVANLGAAAIVFGVDAVVRGVLFVVVDAVLPPRESVSGLQLASGVGGPR